MSSVNSLSSHHNNVPLPSSKVSNNSKKSQRIPELMWSWHEVHFNGTGSPILSCIKSVLCGIENRVIKKCVKCSNFCGIVIDTLFCYLLEKSTICSCFMPSSIQHNLLLLTLDILDKYSTVELSQLETHRFSCFAVHSSFRQIFPIYFRVIA